MLAKRNRRASHCRPSVSKGHQLRFAIYCRSTNITDHLLFKYSRMQTFVSFCRFQLVFFLLCFALLLKFSALICKLKAAKTRRSLRFLVQEKLSKLMIINSLEPKKTLLRHTIPWIQWIHTDDWDGWDLLMSDAEYFLVWKVSMYTMFIKQNEDTNTHTHTLTHWCSEATVPAA